MIYGANYTLMHYFVLYLLALVPVFIAMQDYTSSTRLMQRTGASNWKDLDNLVSANRVPVVRQFMILRHDIKVLRKRLYSRVRDQESRDRELEQEGYFIVNTPTESGTTVMRPTRTTYSKVVNVDPPINRPAVTLRNLAGIEETLRLEYQVVAVEGFSKICHTFRGSSTLETSPGLPSRMLLADMTGTSIYGLQLVITSPWVFSLPGSTMTFTEGSRKKKVVPTPVRYADVDNDRKTKCDVGALLGIFLPHFNVNGKSTLVTQNSCHELILRTDTTVTIQFVLTIESYFMNCVLATAMSNIAPVRLLEVVLTFSGFGSSATQPPKSTERGTSPLRNSATGKLIDSLSCDPCYRGEGLRHQKARESTHHAQQTTYV